MLERLRVRPEALFAVLEARAYIPAAENRAPDEDARRAAPTSYFAAVHLPGRAEVSADPAVVADVIGRQMARRFLLARGTEEDRAAAALMAERETRPSHARTRVRKDIRSLPGLRRGTRPHGRYIGVCMRSRAPRHALSLLLIVLIGGLGMPVLHGVAHAPAQGHPEAVLEAPHAHETACALCDATFVAHEAAPVGVRAQAPPEAGLFLVPIPRTDAEEAASGSRGPPLVG
ncbi:MAG: FMN-binding negative transcriptional regulator [Rubricoccaceae bacterium]